jgi:hypothetical protein
MDQRSVVSAMWEWIKSQPPLPPARPVPPKHFIEQYTEGWAKPLDDATWRGMYEHAVEEWEKQLQKPQIGEIKNDG